MMRFVICAARHREQQSVKRISFPFYTKNKDLYEYACDFDNKADIFVTSSGKYVLSQPK